MLQDAATTAAKTNVRAKRPKARDIEVSRQYVGFSMGYKLFARPQARRFSGRGTWATARFKPDANRELRSAKMGRSARRSLGTMCANLASVSIRPPIRSRAESSRAGLIRDWVRRVGAAGWSRRALGLLLGGLVLWVAFPKTSTEVLMDRSWTSTRILDRDGRVLHERASKLGTYGRWVPLEEISPILVKATIASEDKNFRSHPGIDPTGIVRALWLNIRAGAFRYGGSTITQQLAKMLQRQPRTLLGKTVEAIDALRLERTLSKDQILEQYLNRAYYGRNAYGVDAAARRLFGVSARALSPDQAALLAVLPRSPARYNLEKAPEAAKQRRAHIVAEMVDDGVLDRALAARIIASPVALIPRPVQAATFGHIVDRLEREGVLGAGDLDTRIDRELTERAMEHVAHHVESVAGQGVTQASVVIVENATGDVIALVGSRDYGDLQSDGAVNGATALRHPGSTLKPFAYALAIEDGANASTPVFDVPSNFRGYQPRNVDGSYRGLVSLRESLGSSLNVPATRVAAAVGPQRLANLLTELGVASIELNPSKLHGATLALGSSATRLIELVGAYSALARGGEWVAPRIVRSDARPMRRVLSTASAYVITEILSDAAARRRTFGVETPLEFEFPVAAKSGTSQGMVDGLVVGYTTDLTLGVWTGNFDGRPMHNVLAMDVAAPLFRDMMILATEHRRRRGFHPARFQAPPDVERVAVCSLSGATPNPYCSTTREEHVPRSRAARAPCVMHTATGLRVPAEVVAMVPNADVLPGDNARDAVEILAPLDGAHFRIDPVTPRATQVVTLRAATRVPGSPDMEWEIDGPEPTRVVRVAFPYSLDLPIRAGRHRIRARSAVHGEWTSPVHFHVD